MFYRAGVLVFMSFCFLSLPISAKTYGVEKVVITASAESSPSDSDKKKERTSDKDPASADESFENVARREPEPLTPQGAVGVLLLIGAVGGLSWWIMRPMFQEHDDDDDDTEEA